MICQLVYFAVWLSAVRAQNAWPYPFQQPQLPPSGQQLPLQNGGFPQGVFVPLGSNGLQQPFDGFAYGNRWGISCPTFSIDSSYCFTRYYCHIRPTYNTGPTQPIPLPQPIPPPRMQLMRIQLLCESVPAQQPTVKFRCQYTLAEGSVN